MATSFSVYDIIDENILTDPNYMDWLRNLRIRFAQEKVSYVLKISDPGSVSDNAFQNKKAKDVSTDITYYFCGKLEYSKNNYKNYFTNLK